jgi:hypothetical protein
MQGLQVWNEQVAIRVSREGRLSLRLAARTASADRGSRPERGRDEFSAEVELLEGTLKLGDLAPASGLLYYALPCVYESVAVHVEGMAAPVLERAVGQWPADVDDDHLEAYPHLHFLEERKTGIPWRLERWYTLAGPYLIFDSQQYFERSRPRQRGKDWERLIVQLRQVVDAAAWAQNRQMLAVNLISPDKLGDHENQTSSRTC